MLSKHLFIISCLALCLSYCSNDAFNGKAKGKKSKSSGDAGKDESASEPVMVGGAYLVCEKTQGSSQFNYGCALNDRAKIKKLILLLNASRQHGMFCLPSRGIRMSDAPATSKFHKLVAADSDELAKKASLEVSLKHCRIQRPIVYRGSIDQATGVADSVDAIALISFDSSGGIGNTLDMPVMQVLFESAVNIEPEKYCKDGHLNDFYIQSEFENKYEKYQLPQRFNFADGSYCIAGIPKRGRGCFVVPVIGRQKQGQLVIPEATGVKWGQIEGAWMSYSCPQIGSQLY